MTQLSSSPVTQALGGLYWGTRSELPIHVGAKISSRDEETLSARSQTMV